MPRFRLVGYSGDRPPVPGSTPVAPNDPTSGGGGSGGGTPGDSGESGTPPEPLVLILNHGDVFHKADYLALGYNRFDVMAIGAAGGRGAGREGEATQVSSYRYRRTYYTGNDHESSYVSGGVTRVYFSPIYATDTSGSITASQIGEPGYGGTGGGGGVHRVQGRLALLPSSCPVQVGIAGTNQPLLVPTNQLRLGGGGGGLSSFADTIARGGGGSGGSPFNPRVPDYNATQQQSGGYSTGPSGGPYTYNPTIYTGGTQGGAGGGAGTTGSQFNGSDTWNGSVGLGGAGSAYGRGSNGAVSASEPLIRGVTAPYVSTSRVVKVPAIISQSDYPNAVPAKYQSWGYTQYNNDHDHVEEYAYTDSVLSNQQGPPTPGGGATLFPLNGDTKQYGSYTPGAEPNGVVAIKLSYVIV